MRLDKALENYPRFELSRWPTPLDSLKHVSREVKTQVLLKRDDLTDLALGGDKPRKLEYEIAFALERGADTLVTCGSAQSNHARLTTAAARRAGMGCSVVLSKDEWESFQGNALTVHLMGAEVRMVETEDHWDLESHALALCAELERQGKSPHYIPISGTTPRSCLGYVQAALETLAQIEAQGKRLDAVYAPFGTGGIFSAFLIGLRAEGIQCPVIGISVNRDRSECESQLVHWWQALAELLELDADLAKGDYEIHDEFIGAGYGDPTDACLEAIAFMARHEGILLDPVYSGKMFSGFLAHQQTGRWGLDQSVLLIHSGGVPALFAYHEVIEQHLISRGLIK